MLFYYYNSGIRMVRNVKSIMIERLLTDHKLQKISELISTKDAGI